MSPAWRGSTSAPCYLPGVLPLTRKHAADHPADLESQQGSGCCHVADGTGEKPFPAMAACTLERAHILEPGIPGYNTDSASLGCEMSTTCSSSLEINTSLWLACCEECKWQLTSSRACCLGSPPPASPPEAEPPGLVSELP